jgi:hypothetical protein
MPDLSTVEPVGLEGLESTLRVAEILEHHVDDALRWTVVEGNVDGLDGRQLFFELMAQFFVVGLPERRGVFDDSRRVATYEFPSMMLRSLRHRVRA